MGTKYTQGRTSVAFLHVLFAQRHQCEGSHKLRTLRRHGCGLYIIECVKTQEAVLANRFALVSVEIHGQLGCVLQGHPAEVVFVGVRMSCWGANAAGVCGKRKFGADVAPF